MNVNPFSELKCPENGLKTVDNMDTSKELQKRLIKIIILILIPFTKNGNH